TECAAAGTKQRREVVARAASAVEHVQIAPPAGDVRDRGRDEAAESSKPEVRRLDAAGQLEGLVHRSASFVRAGSGLRFLCGGVPGRRLPDGLRRRLQTPP